MQPSDLPGRTQKRLGWVTGSSVVWTFYNFQNREGLQTLLVSFYEP